MELQSSWTKSLPQDEASQSDDSSQWEDEPDLKWHESSEWEDASKDVWLERPISQSVNDHIGRSQPGNRFLAGLEIWNWMSETLGDQIPNVSLFHFLSVSQVNSYRLLLEWWEGRSQLVAPSEHARKVLTLLSDSRSNSWRLRRSKALRLYPDNIKSPYNRALSLLFQTEFCQFSHDTRPNKSLKLQNERHLSAQLAACQRIAHSFYFNDMLSSSQAKEELSASNQMRKEMDNHIGASIQPCRWLNLREKSKDQLPKYLWDVAAKQTVLAKEIKEFPQYVTISHTWGRWRVRDRPRVEIQGVPWLVPENTRFCIQDLPDELQRLPFSCAYIWFDLFCIPQDRSKEAQVEISRQAAIFAGAACSVVWLNEVETWNGVDNALHWLSLGYMKKFGLGTYNIRTDVLDDMMVQIVDTLPANLFNGKIIRPYWLTSLWTLQEVCLRPDMFICNRTWQILKINPTVPIALDTITALLLHTIMNDNLGIGKYGVDGYPTPVGELYIMLCDTGLIKLPIMSQLDVMMFGEQRYCEARRAEAIMSVLGTTDWFNDQLSQSPISLPNDHLVLGKYPISFVRELKKKLGAGFFGGVYSFNLGSIFDELDQDCQVDRPNVLGTLLPFQPGYCTELPKTTLELYTNQDHSTVKNWEILLDGSVRVTKAAVIGWPANTNQNATEITARFYGGNIPRERQRTTAHRSEEDIPKEWQGPQGIMSDERLNWIGVTSRECSLPSWFQSFRPQLQKYAVCLAKEGKYNIQGIVLMQTPSKNNTFVKIGNIKIYADEQEGEHIPIDTMICDWRVI